jgi:hypothetical protein
LFILIEPHEILRKQPVPAPVIDRRPPLVERLQVTAARARHYYRWKLDNPYKN